MYCFVKTFKGSLLIGQLIAIEASAMEPQAFDTPEISPAISPKNSATEPISVVILPKRQSMSLPIESTSAISPKRHLKRQLKRSSIEITSDTSPISALIEPRPVISPKRQHKRLPIEITPVTSLTSSPTNSPTSSPRSYDDQLRQEIINHIQNHKDFFTLAGLKKCEEFLIELEKLIHNQVLLRADNQELQQDILCLLTDYKKLITISAAKSPILDVNECLLEILKVYYEEDLSLDLLNAHRFEKQVHSLNVMKFECSQFVVTMREKLPDMSQKSVGAIQSATALQQLMYNYLTKYKEFFHEIEIERRDFCLMLKKFCGESRKDIMFNAALDDLSFLIAEYKSAEQDMIENLKKEESEDTDSPENTPRTVTQQKPKKTLSSFWRSSKSSDTET